MPFKFSQLSKRPVMVDMASYLQGAADNLSGVPAFLAFVAPGTLPQAADWVVAHWDTEQVFGMSSAAIFDWIGTPDGSAPTPDKTLAAGEYFVWAKVVSPVLGTVVEQVDTLTVTGANQRILVVSAQEMSTYMGFPFTDEQIPAVEQVISALQGEAEDYLRADLTVQQWTEVYTIPLDGPAPFVAPYIGYDYQNLYPDSEMFNLGWTTGQVLLKHWPVVSWVSLAVNQSAALAMAGTAPAPVWVPIVPPTYPEALPTFAPGTQVQVIYTAGWDGPNIETIKSTIKRAAARELTNRVDDAVGIKGFSVVRLPDPGAQANAVPGLTDDEKKRISRYKNYMII